MTLHERVLIAALGAVLAAQGSSVAVAQPTPHPISLACQQALEYEQTAATDALAPQAAYDASVAGLEANKRCNDEPMRLTREAYLLSMRAAAEHALKVGDWKRDLVRANMLLANCAARPDIKRAVGDDCRRQARYNDDWLKKTQAQAAATQRPAAVQSPSPGASPRPLLVPAAGPPAPPTPRP